MAAETFWFSNQKKRFRGLQSNRIECTNASGKAVVRYPKNRALHPIRL